MALTTTDINLIKEALAPQFQELRDDINNLAAALRNSSWLSMSGSSK